MCNIYLGGKKNKSLKFKTMDNIKGSKEYKLAKEWEMAVNSFSFNPKRFAAAIPDMHPTLQQSLYRLIKECIVVGKSSVSCPLKPSDSAPLKHSTMPP